MSQDRDSNAMERADVTEHTRRNFVVIVGEATAFMSGLAWVDPSAVLPMFIGLLTPSTVVIGLVTVLQRLGWMLPQVLMASVLGHRPRRLAFLRYPALVGRMPFMAFVAYLWLRGVSSPETVIWFLVIAYTCISLGNGVLGIAWQDIIAKSIPSRLRGRFFGTMQFSTAVAAFAVGFGVRWMLGSEGPGFPRDYTILFTLMAVSLGLSTFGLWLVREPVRPVLQRRQSVREIVAGAMPLLRERREFRRLVLTGLLGFGMSFTMPFYIVYARQDLGVPAETAGIYIWAAMFGSAISSIIWGYLNDRRGPATVVRGGCALVMITPLLAIVIPWLMGVAEGPFPNAEQYVRYAFALVFVAGGSAMGAMWMGLTNYLFELTGHEERPRYLALMNMLTAPGAFAPLLVGWMLTVLPFVVVFSFVAACGAGAVVLSRRLPEPRSAAAAE